MIFSENRYPSRVKPGTGFFGIMREPKRNVPPRRAALFSFYCRVLPCQHGRGVPLADSIMPQVPILLEKLLVDGNRGLQTLARDSHHIVAFRSADTTSRTAGAISSSSLKRTRPAREAVPTKGGFYPKP